MFLIPGFGNRELRPVFEAQAGSGDNSVMRRIAHAAGNALSQMGYLAFALGICLTALYLIPVSAGASASMLALPGYLAAAGGAGFLVGEVVKHMSDRQVAKLTFRA